MNRFPCLFHWHCGRSGISFILLIPGLLLLTACLADGGLDNNPKDIPPLLESASFNTTADKVILTFSESVKETKESFAAFTLGGTSHLTVTSLGIDSGDDRVVTLELDSPLESQVQETTLSYHVEKGGITDLAGNALEGFAHRAVKDPRPFMLTFLITEENLDLLLPAGDGHESQAYNINWGDGEIETITAGGDAGPHTYDKAGTYQVRISSDFTQMELTIYANPFPAAAQLQSIDQWGDTHWLSMDQAFEGAVNMVLAATDVPNLTRVVDANRIFQDAASFDGNISQWNMGNVDNMDRMFKGASSFTGDLSQWDVGKATAMSSTFSFATSFNGDISQWNVENVADMGYLFQEARSFTGKLNQWDVGKVVKMDYMFDGAVSFDSDINLWNVENVNDMNRMFNGAVSFNRDLHKWNMEKVNYLNAMFQGATSFNGNIEAWNVENVLNTTYMFNKAESFNRDIGGWNVGKVTNMDYMFQEASSFNQDISLWNVRNVQSMTDMFKGAQAFNQNLGPWYITLDKTTLEDTTDSILLDAQNVPLSEQLHDTIPYTLISIDGAAYNSNNSSFVLNGKTLTHTGAATKEYVLEFRAEPADTPLFGAPPTVAFTINVSG